MALDEDSRRTAGVANRRPDGTGRGTAAGGDGSRGFGGGGSGGGQDSGGGAGVAPCGSGGGTPAGRALANSRSSGESRGVAGLSGTRARQHHYRRTDQDGLVRVE